jgi:hypothetical protein
VDGVDGKRGSMNKSRAYRQVSAAVSTGAHPPGGGEKLMRGAAAGAA